MNHRICFRARLILLILRIVARGPLHGYAIARRIREISRDGLVIEEGSLYPALNRLTAAGRRQLDQGTADFEKLIRAIQLVLKHA